MRLLAARYGRKATRSAHDEDTGLIRRVTVCAVVEIFASVTSRAIGAGVRPDLRHAPDRGLLHSRRVGDDQQHIADRQLEVGSFEPQLASCPRQASVAPSTAAGSRSIRRALRLLRSSRKSAAARPDPGHSAPWCRSARVSGLAACSRRAGGLLHGEGKMGARGQAGRELIAEQARLFEDREALGRRAQIGFVGDALLIKRQHVARHRPGVEQRDGEIVVVARSQLAQHRPPPIGQARQQTLSEARIGADPIGDGGSPGRL